MSRTDDTISVAMDHPGKGPSQGRLQQLDNARKSAVLSRKVKQRARLEQKLRELRELMGDDLNNEQLGRVASRLLAQEETLRAKQNEITQACNDNLHMIQESLLHLTRLIEKSHGTRATTPHTNDRYFTAHGSTVGSVATLAQSSRPRSPRGQR